MKIIVVLCIQINLASRYGSHDIADEIHISDNDDTFQRYKDVFRAIFDSNFQSGHYNQMIAPEIEENSTT